jgi:hypothetical protein
LKKKKKKKKKGRETFFFCFWSLKTKKTKMMMMMMMVVIVMMMGSAAAVPLKTGLNETAPIWPVSWFTVLSRTTTDANGQPVPTRAYLQWYDFAEVFPQGALRQDRISADSARSTSSSLHINDLLYSIDFNAEVCFVSNLGIGPVRPDWLVGGEYLGEEIVRDTLCEVWDKKGGDESHLYYQSLPSGLPVRLTTTNQAGEYNVKDYASVDVTAFNSSDVFLVPDYCRGVPITALPVGAKMDYDDIWTRLFQRV